MAKENPPNRIPHKVATVEEADAEIAATMKEYPHLSYFNAVRLVCYRTTRNHSMMIANSSGGGAYSAFLRKMGVKH